MVNIMLFSKKQQAERDRENLYFHIQNTAHIEKKEDMPLEIPRAIFKIHKIYAYDVQSMFNPINILQNRRLEEAKAQVIAELSQGEYPNIDIRFAESIAYRELQKSEGEAQARYFSKIISYDTMGYGPISILLQDKANLEEIEVNSPTSRITVVHSKYGRCVTNMRFTSEEGFRRTINRFIYDSEKELSDQTPIIDVQVADARIHAQCSPYATAGANATIRIGANKSTNIISMLNGGTFSADTLAYLWIAVESGANMIVSGSPASGKTSLLISILSLVQRYRRIVTLEEDISELKFLPNVTNVVQLNGFHSPILAGTKDQAKNALRMRPDVLAIGEMRGAEAKELFAGANLGVQFMTTMHSNDTPIATLNRLLTKPMDVDPRTLAMLDLCICMAKREESSKCVSNLLEYRWLSRAETGSGAPDVTVLENGDSVEIKNMIRSEVFDYDSMQNSKILEMFSRKRKLSKDDALKEFQKRKNFVRALSKKNLSTLEIVEAIHNY